MANLSALSTISMWVLDRWSCCQSVGLRVSASALCLVDDGPGTAVSLLGSHSLASGATQPVSSSYRILLDSLTTTSAFLSPSFLQSLFYLHRSWRFVSLKRALDREGPRSELCSFAKHSHGIIVPSKSKCQFQKSHFLLFFPIEPFNAFNLFVPHIVFTFF